MISTLGNFAKNKTAIWSERSVVVSGICPAKAEPSCGSRTATILVRSSGVSAFSLECDRLFGPRALSKNVGVSEIGVDRLLDQGVSREDFGLLRGRRGLRRQYVRSGARRENQSGYSTDGEGLTGSETPSRLHR